jgi:hypothetical protein
MATLGGATSWGFPFLRQIWVDGLFMQAFTYPLPWTLPAAAGAMTMMDGSMTEVRIFRGGTAPTGMRPYSIVLTGTPFSSDEEYAKLCEMEAADRSLPVFFERPITDVWVAQQGQSRFSFARFLAVGTVSGVTLTSHPCQAWLNDVPQTVVTGSPSTGEVQIIATDPLAQHNAVVTPSLNSADVLKVQHYPLHYVRAAANPSYVQLNEWVWSGTLSEVLIGDYS